MIQFNKVSVDLDGAAEATGLSKRTVQQAVIANELIAHYVGRKPVFRLVDLDEWIASLPTEAPARVAS